MSNALPVIYIVDPSVAVTGAFIAARNEARALDGIARVVLVVPQNSTIPAEMLGDFWRVDYLPITSLSKNIVVLVGYLPALIRASWQLKKRMESDGASRLQLNDFYLMHGLLLRLFGFRGTIVSWVRCEPRKFVGPLARPMLALMQRAADRVVAVSAFIRTLMPPDIGTDLLYEYYDGPVRAARKWHETEEKPFIYIGNYIRGKGQETALQAFIAAAKSNPTMTLHFYGGDMGLEKNRDYRHALEATVDAAKLQGRIHFHDFITDGFPVLESAYAALNFSHSESFSMTVLEASGAGVPMVATASGGPQEIIRDGVTGYIIPVGDIAAATEKILALAGDTTLAERMGQAAAQHVGESFSLENFRTQLREILALD